MTKQMRIEPRFESWQGAARELLRDAVPPEAVEWLEGGAAEAAPAMPAAVGEPSPHRVPRRFVEMARQVAGHPSARRWALLYRVLWRIVHEDHDLLRLDTDADVSGLIEMEKAVRSAAPFVPPGGSIPELRQAARACTGCDLYRTATQTVFGQGAQATRIALVGEQPGDQEDLQGRPFVGPAGQVFDRALAAAGIDRTRVYVTNAVKHFKFEPRGKRRIHQKPNNDEIERCRWWLDKELHLIRPKLTVALGATAARALTGRDVTISRVRGGIVQLREGVPGFVTVHPSFLLRLPDEASKAREYARFVDDLRQVARHVTDIRKAA
jgi:uracil-DNA glycosylase